MFFPPEGTSQVPPGFFNVDELNIYVLIEDGSGESREMKFEYRRVKKEIPPVRS